MLDISWWAGVLAESLAEVYKYREVVQVASVRLVGTCLGFPDAVRASFFCDRPVCNLKVEYHCVELNFWLGWVGVHVDLLDLSRG